jgi:hypothetical protein
MCEQFSSKNITLENTTHKTLLKLNKKTFAICIFTVNWYLYRKFLPFINFFPIIIACKIKG